MDIEFRAKVGKKVSRPHPVTKDVVEYVELELGEAKVYLIKSDVLKPEESGELDIILTVSPSGSIYIQQRPTIEGQSDKDTRVESYRKHLQDKMDADIKAFEEKEDARLKFEEDNQREIERLMSLAPPPTSPLSPIERGDIVERDKSQKSAFPTPSGQAPIKHDVGIGTVTTEGGGVNIPSSTSKLPPAETVDDKVVSEDNKSNKQETKSPLIPSNPTTKNPNPPKSNPPLTIVP